MEHYPFLVKGCSHNSILVIIGDLIVVVNIFTLRKGIKEKREEIKGTPDFRLKASKALGRKDLGPDTSGLCRASELGLLWRSEVSLVEPPYPSHYHWEQQLIL